MTKIIYFIILGFATTSYAKVIPTQFDDNRIFAATKFNGIESKMLLDSGGNTGIFPEFAFYWKTKDSKVENGKLVFGQAGPFDLFPTDTLTPNSMRLMAGQDEELIMIRKVVHDGLFGHGWFGNRIWKLNYKKQKLELLDKIEKPEGKKVDLSFKGEGYFYPRMKIKIDNEELDVLLDTGATSVLSENAMKELKKSSAIVSSSFIRESIFNQWKEKHPEWKIISGGDRFGNHDLILAPVIEIAGKKVGPVWFAKRPNKSYDEMMSQYMDCKCAGAIGGNVLKYFEIMLDYPKKTAWFK